MTTQPREVLTVGHSTRSAGELIDLLHAHGVQEVVDVRRFPGSRRHPQFNREALQDSLGEAGIGYVHMVELGGRRGRPDPGSVNGGWRVAAFQAYADRTAEPEWLEALRALEERAVNRRVAYMCSEALPWRCHRRLISDALVARGWEVRHIMGMRRADPHALPDFARVLPDGRLVYPSEDAV